MWYLSPIIKIKDVYTHTLYYVMIVARLQASMFIILSAMRSDVPLGADIGGQNDKITQWGKPPNVVWAVSLEVLQWHFFSLQVYTGAVT